MGSVISSLLKKGSIRVDPPHLHHQGFYSRYFLIPKKDGFVRPILDLNKHSVKYTFRMLTQSTLSCLIYQNDWFTSVNLKDAYFHLRIYPPTQKNLFDLPTKVYIVNLQFSESIYPPAQKNFLILPTKAYIMNLQFSHRKNCNVLECFVCVWRWVQPH